MTAIPATPLTEDEQRRLDAFLQLSRIERGLRSFIQRELRQSDGPKWAKSLPKDVREKVEAGGISGTDFADLKKVLGSAWRKFGSKVNAVKRDQILIHLEGLEPIRNDVAHSRDVSERSLALVRAAYFVAGPLIESPGGLRPLPPTEHASVALERLRGAIQHSSQIAAADVETLHAGGDQEGVCRLIADYERVRGLPGRDPRLLEATRSSAIEALDKSLAAL
jgi:Swt1-like HEPN